MSFKRFQINNQLKNRLFKTLFQKMKFFFNVCNSKFDEINMFFQKNKKFDSNERKFQNDVQINSITNSNSIEFRNLIEQKKNSKFYFRFVLLVNDESNSKNILTISNEFFQFEYEFFLIYFRFRYFVIFFFRNCFSMSVLKKKQSSNRNRQI